MLFRVTLCSLTHLVKSSISTYQGEDILCNIAGYLCLEDIFPASGTSGLNLFPPETDQSDRNNLRFWGLEKLKKKPFRSGRALKKFNEQCYSCQLKVQVSMSPNRSVISGLVIAAYQRILSALPEPAGHSNSGRISTSAEFRPTAIFL